MNLRPETLARLDLLASDMGFNTVEELLEDLDPRWILLGKDALRQLRLTYFQQGTGRFLLALAKTKKGRNRLREAKEQGLRLIESFRVEICGTLLDLHDLYVACKIFHASEKMPVHGRLDQIGPRFWGLRGAEQWIASRCDGDTKAIMAERENWPVDLAWADAWAEGGMIP